MQLQFIRNSLRLNWSYAVNNKRRMRLSSQHLSFLYIHRLFILLLGCQLHSWYGFENNSPIARYLPATRPFIELSSLIGTKPSSTASESIIHGELTILQFNMLADGLSGARPDLGDFSRIQGSVMKWENRCDRLLYEILQYQPDVITLQECDHYYDFFLPQLQSRGYDGIFAPKPASACLQYSNSSDGLAMFYKRNKLIMKSVETITYAVSRRDVNVDGDTRNIDGTHINDELRTQNQVALIAVYELLNKKKNSERKPPIIIATTHLKAQKSFEGELYRSSQAAQLLAAVERCKATTDGLLGRPESQAPSHCETKPAAVIITGDFNAAPMVSEEFGYESIVYPLVKKHPLLLRSVLNDDFEDLLSNQQKQRSSCSAGDLISGEDASETSMVIKKRSKRQTLLSAFTKVMNATSQAFSVGTNKDAAAELNGSPLDRRSRSDDGANDDIAMVDDKDATNSENDEIENKLLSKNRSPIWTTWKARRRRNKTKEKVVKQCIDYIFYNTPDGNPSDSSVGIQALATLPMFTDEEVGEELLPSSSYPSDHIALAAVLQIVERRKEQLK